ncbi:inovirus Gp2 family protein [Moritella viscosa]|uniref:inovirus Gp2 family protein n=1 Tax=Moritella viscosa TaxID=80854 RepID=UPI0009168E33|nr:inovirus Gp2 family protein [Moritella viscosa]SHO14520.1 Putative uncharacterized protein [Moritella viscosa]SHO15469.1 Putative uncharacterized protein [Moritella viscosa]SHO19223.1 Putative uncharacterized protein [Moritella viscosa]
MKKSTGLPTTFEGMKVQTKCGCLEEKHLVSIKETLNLALDEHPKTCAMRFDLHYPDSFEAHQAESKHISKFRDSLKAILDADLKRKKKLKKCTLRKIWVKEQANSVKPHYHAAILVNGHIYNQLGYFTKVKGNMAARIRQAWASALGVELWEIDGVVHFPDKPTYIVNKNGPDYKAQYEKLFYRLSYFAKLDTKIYGGGGNNFGRSHK